MGDEVRVWPRSTRSGQLWRREGRLVLQQVAEHWTPWSPACNGPGYPEGGHTEALDCYSGGQRTLAKRPPGA